MSRSVISFGRLDLIIEISQKLWFAMNLYISHPFFLNGFIRNTFVS